MLWTFTVNARVETRMRPSFPTAWTTGDICGRPVASAGSQHSPVVVPEVFERCPPSPSFISCQCVDREALHLGEQVVEQVRRVVRVVVGPVLADVQQGAQPQADIIEGAHPGVQLLFRKLRRVSGLGKGFQSQGPALVQLGPTSRRYSLFRFSSFA